MNAKGQAWSFDLIMGISIFLIGFSIMAVYFVNISSEDNRFKNLEYEANSMSDSVLSEGNPSDWNSNNVVTPGILTNHVINQTKLEMFQNLVFTGYDTARALLNVNGNFYISFSPNILSNDSEGMGMKNINTDNLIRVERVSAYNDSIVTVIIYLWD